MYYDKWWKKREAQDDHEGGGGAEIFPGFEASVFNAKTETVLSNKITYRNGIVLSFKDSPKKPLRRRPYRPPRRTANVASL